MEKELNVGQVLQEKLRKKVRALQELTKDALEEAGSAGHGDYGDLSRKEEEGRKRSIRMETLSKEIKKIETALARYKKDPGNYGICQECGDQICLARLIARTETGHCVTCKTELEKNSSSMIPAYRSA